MDKQVINADVPTTGATRQPVHPPRRTWSTCRGCHRSTRSYSARLRAARTAGEPIPPFPETPFDVQARW